MSKAATGGFSIFGYWLVSVMLAPAAEAVETGIAGLNVTGFVRQEMALALYGNENPFNQYGNPFNGKAPSSAGPIFGGLPLNFPRTLGAAFPSAYNPANYLGEHWDDEPTWNLVTTRLELDVQYRFNDAFDGYLKVRAVGDGTDSFSSAYDKTDFFGRPFEGGRRANLLEANGEQWLVDFPAAYIDYHRGPLWIRAGNQQIAWGEAIFFRVSDVVNGLDLRRHFFLDVVAEEYADERVPALSVRGSYTFQNGIEIDAFVQKFQPSVSPAENSPYNVIPSQFVVNWKPGYDDADDAVNFGARVTWPLTDDLTVQLLGVSRRNPDGVFRWGPAPATAPGAVCVPGVGCTPFQGAGEGVYSVQEWFAYAARARLNGVEALQAIYDEFPAAELVRQGTNAAFGFEMLPRVSDKTSALQNLDFFFAGGPLRGWLETEYKREEIFGLAGNYIVTGAPGSFFDQLVIRGEMTYALDRKFSNITLSRDFIEADEIQASVVFEKYHRFSHAFPATFMVFEWMFKSESDLFGRHLDGMNNKGFDEEDGRPDGSAVANYLAFAIQQPSPNLVWRADLSVLFDVKGGWFVQPGVRYKPSKNWQFDIYGNFVWSDGGQNDIMETFEWSDELFARVSFFF